MLRDRQEQRRQAELFRRWHDGPDLLLLPNAWDVISARIFETAGFKAIGTTSAGIAATLGYPDGQRISLQEMIAVTRRIVSGTKLPVSADLEAGYADTVEGVVAAVREALETGIVGINLEDSTGKADRPLLPVAQQVERIAAIRAMADGEGIPLVINARTDAYMLAVGDMEGRRRGAIERGRAYLEAGADCVFVPDLEDLDLRAIERLVREIPGPVNLIAGRNTPPFAQLASLGVSRVSFGPRPMRIALALIRNFAREVIEQGTCECLKGDALTYGEMNAMLAGK